MLAAHTRAAITAKLGSSKNGGSVPNPFPSKPSFPGTNSSLTMITLLIFPHFMPYLLEKFIIFFHWVMKENT